VKYYDATRGTLLKALVLSFQLGTRMETQLKGMNDQADHTWEEAAAKLQHGLVQTVHEARKAANGEGS